MNYTWNSPELISLSDEDLIKYHKDDKSSMAVIFSRYYKTVLMKALARNLPSYETDDLVQEGILGLLGAFETFNDDYGNRFSTYANVCITNKISSAYSKLAEGNLPQYSKVEDIQQDINEITPEDIFLEKEKMRGIYYGIIRLLSDKEWKVFSLFLTGCSYEDISFKLNLPLKVVDNAMQRVRRKLKEVCSTDI